MDLTNMIPKGLKSMVAKAIKDDPDSAAMIAAAKKIVAACDELILMDSEMFEDGEVDINVLRCLINICEEGKE